MRSVSDLSRRRTIATLAIGAIAAGLVGLAVGLPLALTHRQDFPFERRYGDFAVSAVSRVLGGNAANPVANDRNAIDAGRVAYTGSCAVCHGAKGDGRGMFGPSTYPDATDLTAATAKEKTDAQLFWIVRSGLAFTAMPAFGDQYKDRQIWEMVAYIRHLQQGSASELSIPQPTAAQLAIADASGDRLARGAAVYFAQGCHLCHGPAGDAPGDLSIRRRPDTEVVRTGADRGMPAYGRDQISDAELDDLQAYLVQLATASTSRD